MNRLLKSAVLALFALIFTVTAFAQEALPLPTPANEAAPRLSISLISPQDGTSMHTRNPFMWSGIGAAKYTFHFTILRTGQKVNWTPTDLCVSDCYTAQSPEEVYKGTNNGDEVTWFITAKLGGVKHKSETFHAFMFNIGAAQLLSPANLVSMPRNEIEGFVWKLSDVGIKHTLVVKDAVSGEIVFKKTITKAKLGTQCAPGYSNSQCAYLFGGNHPGVKSVLKQNRTYLWYVVATGLGGDKAKSAVRTLVTTKDAP